MEREEITASLRAVGEALLEFDNAVAAAIREAAWRFNKRTGLRITSVDVTHHKDSNDTYGRPVRPEWYEVAASVERFAK